MSVGALSPRARRSLIRNATGYAFLTPFLIPFVILLVVPIVNGFYLSLTNTDLGTGDEAFIGLRNYTRLANDDTFVSSVIHTLVFVVESVPLIIGIALLLAVMLNQEFRGRLFARASFVAPYLMTASAATIIWSYLLASENGPLNYYLAQLGLGRQAWLAFPTSAMLAIVGLTVWWRLGFPLLVLLAGLQDIPQELYEAARIDGAGSVTTFRHITVPLLTPVIAFVTVIRMIDSFSVFPQVFLVTNGGPDGSTRPLVQYLYESGFMGYKLGYAAAIGWIFFLIVLAVTLVELRVLRQASPGNY